MQNTLAYLYAQWAKRELASDLEDYGITIEGEVAGFVRQLLSGSQDHIDMAGQYAAKGPEITEMVNLVCGPEYAEHALAWCEEVRQVNEYNARRKPANRKPLPAAPALPTY